MVAAYPDLPGRMMTLMGELERRLEAEPDPAVRTIIDEFVELLQGYSPGYSRDGA